MSVVIHHNPDCGTSRNVLAIIEAAGFRPTVIDGLRLGWTQAQLLPLLEGKEQPYGFTKSPHFGAASVPHGITGTVEVEFCGEPSISLSV